MNIHPATFWVIYELSRGHFELFMAECKVWQMAAQSRLKATPQIKFQEQAQVGNRPWDQGWYAKPWEQQMHRAKPQGQSMMEEGMGSRALGVAILGGIA